MAAMALFLKRTKNMSVICNGVNIKANSDALNFGSTGFWWFKDNISELNDNSCFLLLPEPASTNLTLFMLMMTIN